MTAPSALRTPRATRAGRVADYLGEMFPPAIYVPHGLATVLAPYGLMQALAGEGPLVLTWRAAAGAVTGVLFLLLMRVYDELKDADADRRLASAGDPRYVHRPVVTGRVTVDDLAALRTTVLIALLAVNAPLGAPWPLAGFALTLSVMWASSRWFFWPAVSRDLLLAFVTHNPIAALVAVYALGVYAADFGAPGSTAWAGAVVLASWLPMAAWETSRKVRHPADETDYQTYSKRLGPRAAAVVPAVLVVLAALILSAVGWRAGMGSVFVALVLIAASVGVGASVRFLVAPSTASSRLQPAYEVFTVMSGVGTVVALAVVRGVGLP